jgi:hypothetical protein
LNSIFHYGVRLDVYQAFCLDKIITSAVTARRVD